jgi:hypothetical protein
VKKPQGSGERKPKNQRTGFSFGVEERGGGVKPGGSGFAPLDSLPLPLQLAGLAQHQAADLQKEINGAQLK